MNIEDHAKNPPKSLRTLCYLVKDNQVLLAMKKRGFGMGKYNGVGGKLEKGETVEEAARRETFEEIEVNPINMKEIATLDFYFPAKEEWTMRVITYICDKWEGEPSESEEMKPFWFDQDKIPYDKMWDADDQYLPIILRLQKIHGIFVMAEDNSKVTEFKITEV